MAFVVTVLFSVQPRDSDALVTAAHAMLNELPVLPDDSETRWMCDAFIQDPNRFIHFGNKGDLFVWGGTWNKYSSSGWFDSSDYELPERAIDELTRFLTLALRENAVWPFDRALLLANPEENDRTYVYEFRFSPGNLRADPDVERKIVLRRTVLQMGWDRRGEAEYPGAEADEPRSMGV